MKTTITTLAIIVSIASSFAQETETKKDTTRVNFKNTELILVQKPDHNEFEDDFPMDDTLNTPKEEDRPEAHWSGVDFGFGLNMNNAFGTNFNDNAYWENDPAKSTVWNLNIVEHKFNIAREYFGITTGLGFNFTSVAFNDNYILNSTSDSLYAFSDTVLTYSKNKLKASYLTVPLLLEFNTNMDADKSFYFATGVVGGIRMTSKIKRKGELDGKEFVQKEKGTYSLNPFKLDAAIRMGYGSFGVFANYSLLPLFDTKKTVEVYPLTFGLSMNF